MTNPLPACVDAGQVVADGYLLEVRKDNAGLREQYIRHLTDELPGCSEVLNLGCGAGYPRTEKVPQT
jgi:hypothetical protein